MEMAIIILMKLILIIYYSQVTKYMYTSLIGSWYFPAIHNIHGIKSEESL